MPKKGKNKEKKLTPKQEMFCKEYVIDWNATRAAKAAGYSEKTAQAIGAENLTKPLISARINELKEETEKLLGLSKLRLAQEYMKIGFSSIADIFDDWIEKKEFDKLPKEVKACISEIQSSVRKVDAGDETFMEVEFVKIKTHDKVKALDALAKMFGYNEPEKIKGDFNVNEVPTVKFI